MMTFMPGWDQPKLKAIPDDTALVALRAGKSNTQQKKAGLSIKDIEYANENNTKRLADSIFLTFFNETDVRNAVQRGQASFNSDKTIKILLMDMIGSTVVTRIDQGTHQPENGSGGGFKLHFDVRRSDKLCFHFYVGQDKVGALDIIEISYMSSGTRESLTAVI